MSGIKNKNLNNSKYINDSNEIFKMRSDGYSLKDIGQYFGLSESSICKILNGSRKYKGEKLWNTPK